MFQQALIVGVGLLGSSLSLALKKHDIAKKIVGFSRSQETVNTALELNIISEGSTEITDLVETSDLIIFCVPLSTYASTAEKISPFIKSNAILTDVGSVKYTVIDSVLPVLTPKQRSLFVPGHPIAGSEKSGPTSGDEDLFVGKQVVLTPMEQTNKKTCHKIEEMWSKIGANVIYLSPDKHDDIYASVSHSIQFLAYVFRLAFPGQSKNTDPDFKRFFRIATSNSVLWLDIFKANKEPLLKSLRRFRVEFLELLNAADENKRLPQLIAKAAISMIGENKSYGGSGFKDFTSAAEAELICDQTIGDAPHFLAMLDTLADSLENGSLDQYLPTH